MGVVGVESSVSHTIVEVGHGRQWRVFAANGCEQIFGV